jgi:hypothetical protein
MYSGHVELIPSEQLIMFERHINNWINLQSASHHAPDRVNFNTKVPNIMQVLQIVLVTISLNCPTNNNGPSKWNTMKVR